MNRAQKIGFLTKVLQNKISRRLLQNALPPQPMICIYRPGNAITQPDDIVTVRTGNDSRTMCFKGLEDYALHKRSPIILLIPDNSR